MSSELRSFSRLVPSSNHTDRSHRQPGLSVCRLALILAIAFCIATSSVILFSDAQVSSSANSAPGPSGRNTGNSAEVRLSHNCHGVQYQTDHLDVVLGGEQILASVNWAQNFSVWNATTSYNYSFDLWGLAEVTPSGQVVEYSNLMNPVCATTSMTTSTNEVDLSINETQNVTSASGNWTPSAVSSGVNQTGGALGSVTVNVTFEFKNLSGGPVSSINQLKFNIDESGWPWAHSGDHLGVSLSGLAAGGAHFAWNPSTHNLTQSWNMGGSPLVGMQFGPTASTYGSPGGPGSANVSEDVGLFTGGTPDRISLVLINFAGGGSQYAIIHYDPWIIYSISPPPGGRTGTISAPPAQSTPAYTLAAVAVAAVAVVLLVSAVLYKRRGKVVRPPQTLSKDGEGVPSADTIVRTDTPRTDDPIDHLL